MSSLEMAAAAAEAEAEFSVGNPISIIKQSK